MDFILYLIAHPIIGAILKSLFAVEMLWIFYLAVMNLKGARAAGRLGLTAKLFGYPILFSGLALNFAVNVTIMTVLFFDIPRDFLFSGRVERYISRSGYRGALARFFADSFLDDFDPRGFHIPRGVAGLSARR